MLSVVELQAFCCFYQQNGCMAMFLLFLLLRQEDCFTYSIQSMFTHSLFLGATNQNLVSASTDNPGQHCLEMGVC